MQIHEYASGYQAKTDEELLRLAAERADLTPEASLALEGELARRRISVERWPGNLGVESREQSYGITLPKSLRAPQTAGQFLADVWDVYQRHLWFFFKLGVPLVALSWMLYYVTTHEINAIARQLLSRYGHLDRPLELLEMLLLRVAQSLGSWIMFSLLFGAFSAATREVDSGGVPSVFESLSTIRLRMGRFWRLSLVLFGLALVAIAASGLVTAGLFWGAKRVHLSSRWPLIFSYAVTVLAFLTLSRFALAMPAVILDGYGVAQSLFLSDELTERKWTILAALLAKSVIGGYIAGMSPFWLASFLSLRLPGWFHWVLSALSIAAVSAVEPVMFIGFALLYIRMSVDRSGFSSAGTALAEENQPT